MTIQTRLVLGIAMLFAVAAVALGVAVSLSWDAMLGGLAIGSTVVAAAGLIYVTLRFG